MKLVSLRLKILVAATLACSLIVLVVSLAELVHHREALKTKTHDEFMSFEQGAKHAIREAVWRYDWEMVKTILESQTSQVISFVEICDNKAARCLQHGTRNHSPYLEYSSSISYSDKNSKEQMEIGTIYLQSHFGTFMHHIGHHLPRFFFTNIMSVFGIALVLFILFHQMVVQRLLALEQYTRKIDLQKIGDMDESEAFSKRSRRDEIDLLADAVTGLIEKTQNELARRENLEKQLNQAQKMEALGNLAGGIAHDFNNILAAILGFAELSYLKSKPESDIHRNLEKIINAGQRAKNLTAQILVFSRGTEAPKEVLVLADVANEALNLIRASLPSGIRIETDLDTEARVKGDSTRLHQVMMNIATNGVQAIGESGGILKLVVTSVTLGQEEAERLVLPAGRYSLLEIHDDGPGIPAEIQARVFEPFFTTKKVGKGTGMGLAVVHGIVQNHGGTIIMNSREGHGTCFSIYLPQTDQNVIEADTLSDIEKGKGQRILLVDDESQVLDMGVSILEDLGYTVTSFNDPAAAVAYAGKATSIDLVITDLTMPEMSGIELAGLLRTYHPDVPILLWTGYKDNIESENLDKKLISSILQKPFDMQGLAKAVSSLIAKEKN